MFEGEREPSEPIFRRDHNVENKELQKLQGIDEGTTGTSDQYERGRNRIMKAMMDDTPEAQHEGVETPDVPKPDTSQKPENVTERYKRHQVDVQAMMRGDIPVSPDIPNYRPAEGKDTTPQKIVDVPTSLLDLDDPDKPYFDIDTYNKIPDQEIEVDLNNLQEIQKMQQEGLGQTSEYWRQFDQNNGWKYSEGYQKTYERFYGDNPVIKLTQLEDGSYYIDNGHRYIYLAQHRFETLPARVKQFRTQHDDSSGT